MAHTLKKLAIPVLVAATASAHGEVRLNGFLSFVGGATKDNDRSYQGYDDDWTFDNDSRMGLQATGDIDDKLSATAQIVARGNESYDAEFEWAYLSYQAQDNLTLRAGRFRTPFYIYSDFIDVGYAYHWITPPDQVYSLPFNNIEGLDAVYRMNTGSVDHMFQAYYGSLDDELSQSGMVLDTRIRDQFGAVWSGTVNGWLTLRASYHTAKVTIPIGQVPVSGTTTLDDIHDTITGLGYGDNADRIYVSNTRFDFGEVGAKVDWNNWLFVAEYTVLEPDQGIYGDQKRWYTSAAYTLGPVQLHATYSEADDDPADLADGIAPLGPGPLFAAAATAASNTLNQIAEANAAENDSLTLGLRYDFHPSAALKAEWVALSDDINDDADLMRVAVDVVF